MDSIRGYTVAGYNLLAVALSHATAIAWLQILSLSIGIVVGVLTAAEKISKWRRERRDRLPLVGLVVALLCSGCAGPQLSRHVVTGTGQVQEARVSVVKARVAAERATLRVESGKQAVAELAKTATLQQRPLVATVRRSLAEIEAESNIMRVSLNEIAPRLESAQGSIDALGQKLLRAERQAASYRRLRLWLAVLAASVAGYVAFRVIPPVVGPYRFYGAGVAALAVGSITFFVL